MRLRFKVGRFTVDIWPYHVKFYTWSQGWLLSVGHKNIASYTRNYKGFDLQLGLVRMRWSR